MEREAGNKRFPIWLLGDSEPKNWQHILQTLLDPRHPVRHNIWTSVLEAIQDYVFRELRNRVDTSLIYIRNAVGDPSIKPPPKVTSGWDPRVEAEIVSFAELINEYSPKFVLCFGAFAFEFARRARGYTPQYNYDFWGAKRLGNEFRSRINQFDPGATNIIPVLHRSIAGGKFIQAHELFCGAKGANYFNFVGTEIAKKIIEHSDELDIWMDREGTPWTGQNSYA